jgi:hypothetical protein
VVVAIWLCFLRRRTLFQLYCGLAVLIIMAFVSYNVTLRSAYQSTDAKYRTLIWSPYYKIIYTAEEKTINTNNIAHQAMVEVHTKDQPTACPIC